MNKNKRIEYTRFEDLPNDIFYEIQTYFTLNDLYKIFSNLNLHFDNILMSMNNLYFEIYSTVENQRLITNYFASNITHIIIPENSDAVSIATIFTNIRLLIFYRPIRLPSTIFSTVKQIKLDLSNIRLKHAIGLFHSIFSDNFHCLSSFYILHKKIRVVGHWNPLIHSIRHQCLTLTEFIFDIQPTIEWNMLEHFLKYMPNLQRLIIQKLNTRNRWTLSIIAQTLKINLPKLNYLFICINSLGINIIIQPDDNYYLLHPLFINIQSKKVNSRKIYSTTIISSQIR